MKITIAALIIFCFFTLQVFAQNSYSIKGSVADTASRSKLNNATVAVLSAKDSTLQKFTRVNEGQFTFNNLQQGKYILMLTYSGYADYVERFTLDSAHNSHDFGHISMILKTQLLAEVIVKAKAAAIKIKGDTTEYNAKAFTVQPNAKVEDLLKELPGIQVDKDGKITAQGQTVNKVLVDGEEFFGDDPTLVTKNLRADMVDKVQVYDKKSDQAAFTGIDDGKQTKTINIKLKEDKKNGYFGKLDAEGGTGKYYQEQLLFNRFKGKQKFSVYGTLGNTGKIGLGWDDNSKYGGDGGEMEFGDGGEMYFYGGGGDDLDSYDGRFDGQGIPLARSGGVHYDTKWNADKQSINTNYKIGSLNVDGTKNTQTQNNVPGDIKNSSSSNSDQTFHNYIFRQKLDATYQVKLDTTSNLKLMVDGTTKNSTAKNDYSTLTHRGDGSLWTGNDRSVNNDVDSKIFNASAFYTKKFKKKGRTFSLRVSDALNQSDSKGFLKAHTMFFDTLSVLYKIDTTNQRKTNKTKSNVLNSSLTYTEPLSKQISMILNYGININNSSSDRRTYDQSAPGIYNKQVDSLSNDFKLNQVSNEGGLSFNFKQKKSTFNFGTSVSAVSFEQADLMGGTPTITRHFVNWTPQASFQYRFSQQQSFRVSYYGYTTQPTLQQIQPLKENTDNLNITLGNPDLKPAFSNHMYISYNSYKVLSGQAIWISGSYSNTYNPIVSNMTTDTSGKSTYQYSNLKNKQTVNMSLNVNLDRKINFLDMNAGLGLSGNGSNYYNFVKYGNNPAQLGKTQSYSYSADLRLSKNKQKKYDLYASAGPNYTINSSSLQPALNNNGRGFNSSGSATFYLPWHFSVSSDVNYQFNAKTKTFDQDFKKTTLNASIGKSFLKDENIKLNISGNDLLNQNTGYNRTGDANQLTQERYTTIRRYFMLSLTWDFNHIAGGAAPQK